MFVQFIRVEELISIIILNNKSVFEFQRQQLMLFLQLI